MVLTEENVISSLDLRSGDICEPSYSQISKSKVQFLIFCSHLFPNICGFLVVQSGDMSLTRTIPWISLVYHMENVSQIFVSLGDLPLRKLLYYSCLFISFYYVSSTHGIPCLLGIQSC